MRECYSVVVGCGVLRPLLSPPPTSLPPPPSCPISSPLLLPFIPFRVTDKCTVTQLRRHDAGILHPWLASSSVPDCAVEDAQHRAWSVEKREVYKQEQTHGSSSHGLSRRHGEGWPLNSTKMGNTWSLGRDEAEDSRRPFAKDRSFLYLDERTENTLRTISMFLLYFCVLLLALYLIIL